MQPLRTVALFLTAALLVPAALADRRDVDLPEFGEPADVVLSPAKEYEIGSQVVAQMYAYDFILEDPELQHYLSILGWKLAAQIPQKPQQLNFFLVKDPRINAFALPGGFIGFNAGLITASESESEVAGVMAHELTHVTQRHIARTIQGTKTANIATWLGVLAAIIAGSANPDVVLAALSLGQGLSYQNQVNYRAPMSWKQTGWAYAPWSRPASTPKAWPRSSSVWNRNRGSTAAACRKSCAPTRSTPPEYPRRASAPASIRRAITRTRWSTA